MRDWFVACTALLPLGVAAHSVVPKVPSAPTTMSAPKQLATQQNYFCWRTSQRGASVALAACGDYSPSVTLSRAETGSGNACGPHGSYSARWNDKLEVQVSVIECAGSYKAAEAVSVPGTLVALPTPTLVVASNYLCWRSATEGASVPDVSCGAAGNSVVSITASTTGASGSSQCNAVGAPGAVLGEVTEKQVRAVECSQAVAAVGSAMKILAGSTLTAQTELAHPSHWLCWRSGVAGTTPQAECDAAAGSDSALLVTNSGSVKTGASGASQCSYPGAYIVAWEELTETVVSVIECFTDAAANDAVKKYGEAETTRLEASRMAHPIAASASAPAANVKLTALVTLGTTASYFCWRSGAAGSNPVAECPAARVEVKSIEVKASTTGAVSTCGPSGSYEVEWVAQYDVSVIECFVNAAGDVQSNGVAMLTKLPWFEYTKAMSEESSSQYTSAAVLDKDAACIATRIYMYRAVHIAAGVVRIAPGAFAGCSEIAVVDFRDASELVSIGAEAFRGVRVHTLDFHLAVKLRDIDVGAFADATELGRLTLASSLASIRPRAFQNTNLKASEAIVWNGVQCRCFDYNQQFDFACPVAHTIAAFTYEASSECTSSVGALTYEASNGMYPYCTSATTSVSVPATEVVVAPRAFAHCTTVTSIDFKGTTPTLETVGAEAFAHTSIARVVLPDSVTAVRSGAFYSCGHLASLTMSANTATVEARAFQRTALDAAYQVEWNSGANAARRCKCFDNDLQFDFVCPTVERRGSGDHTKEEYRSWGAEKHVERYAVDSQWNSAAPTDATGPCAAPTTATLTRANQAACASTTERCCIGAATTVVIDATVTMIRAAAFFHCTSLQTVDFSSATGLLVISKAAFSTTGIASVDLSGATALHTVGEGAFSDNVELHSVSLASAIQRIGPRAFLNSAPRRWSGSNPLRPSEREASAVGDSVTAKWSDATRRLAVFSPAVVVASPGIQNALIVDAPALAVPLVNYLCWASAAAGAAAPVAECGAPGTAEVVSITGAPVCNKAGFRAAKLGDVAQTQINAVECHRDGSGDTTTAAANRRTFNYFCWRSSATAGADEPTCGPHGGAAVEINSATASATVCGPRGVDIARWDDSSQVEARYIECTGGRTGVPQVLAPPTTVGMALPAITLPGVARSNRYLCFRSAVHGDPLSDATCGPPRAYTHLEPLDFVERARLYPAQEVVIGTSTANAPADGDGCTARGFENVVLGDVRHTKISVVECSNEDEVVTAAALIDVALSRVVVAPPTGTTAAMRHEWALTLPSGPYLCFRSAAPTSTGAGIPVPPTCGAPGTRAVWIQSDRTGATTTCTEKQGAFQRSVVWKEMSQNAIAYIECAGAPTAAAGAVVVVLTRAANLNEYYDYETGTSVKSPRGVNAYTDVVWNSVQCGCHNSASQFAFACDSSTCTQHAGELTYTGSEICSSATTSIVISSAVTVIPDGAFAHCASVTTVDFSSATSLVTIGKSAFAHTGLAVADLSSAAKLQTVGLGAFSMCSSLVSVSLVSSIAAIHPFAFYNDAVTNAYLPSESDANLVLQESGVTWNDVNCNCFAYNKQWNFVCPSSHAECSIPTATKIHVEHSLFTWM